MSKPAIHSQKTEELARSLKPEDVYKWFVSIGYFPETYVLPPCFHVQKHQSYNQNTRYFTYKEKEYKPTILQLCELHFPKSNFTDRNFGIIHPKINSDIAYEFAENWKDVLDTIFHPDKCIYSYSFPLPLDASNCGSLGKLRSGRMIYEYIEMAENDLVEEAYKYKYIVRTDIKNFYPSVYTHSIAWAFHTKATIRNKNNRSNFNLLGNRLDKLFQNANDGCTNGLPIGPAVSDLISEIILCAVDLQVSNTVNEVQALAVRFKDDYRFLCKSENDCQRLIKSLQKHLKEYNLVVNEDKTNIKELPEGIFREWRSKYYQIRPSKNKKLSFEDFQEFYLGVLRIDKENPGTGIIDRFIADIMDKKYKPLIEVDLKTTNTTTNKLISLLLLISKRRISTFPKILGVIEGMMIDSRISDLVEEHLRHLLEELKENCEENLYLISWILYFLKSKGFEIENIPNFNHPIIKSIECGENKIFTDCSDFSLYREISKVEEAGCLSYHLDVFKR